MKKKQYTIDDLFDILVQLRGENGCPWDRAQTHESIKKSMIEETYEAIDALNAGDDAMFANELGDVLLQVAFHAQLAKERGAFDFDTILNEICTKLISRHTHVFGEDKAENAKEALNTWEANKKKEKGLDTYSELLKDVPHHLPALMRAEKVQKKASSAGFDWKDIEGAQKKVIEELQELKAAQEEGSQEHIEEEFGDLLFAAVNVGRFLKVTPEICLADATDKFIARFEKMEQEAIMENKDISSMKLQELDALWEKIKKK